MKERFYFPLTVNYCERGEYEGHEKDSIFANLYEFEIQKAFEEYAGNGEMSEYIHSKSLKSKINSMKWGFITINNKLYGIVDVEFLSVLTEKELEELKDFICGQNSDGLGEGFEQQEINISEGYIYVSFWRWDNYWIYTEEEFFEEEKAEG